MAKRAKVDPDADLRRIVLDRLPVKKPEYNATLAALPMADLLIRYFNWLGRMVPTQRRTVLRSTEMASSPAYNQRRGDIDMLCAKIAAGCDLTPHLSTLVEIGYEEDKRGRAGRGSLDLLLNDWGVHHLHINHQLRPDGRFVERSSELLFVIFRPDAAYIHGVFSHDDWTREDIVRIAVRNWPKQHIFMRLNGVSGLERPISEDDRKQLRNSHVNALIELDEGVFMGRGFSSAGTSDEALKRTDQLRANLRAYQADEAMIIERMKAQSDNDGKRIPLRPTFEVIEARSDGGYGFAFREKKSGATLWIG